MSLPFNGKPFTFTQPDGTALWVRGWGDQHHAVFETLNGYTVVRDPASGYYQYATVDAQGDELVPTGALPRHGDPVSLGIPTGVRISPQSARATAREAQGLLRGRSRWEARRREAKEQLRQFSARGPGIALAPPQRETTGDFVGLCLLIQFPDVPGTIPREEVEAFCNRTGYSGFGNNGSVRDYFLEISGGRLRYTNLVAPYYTAQHPRAYYTDRKVAFGLRARELVKEALLYHHSHGMDFGDLTADSQQYVYATNVFYAGPRINAWREGLWPHSSSLQTPLALAAGKNAFDYQITDMSDALSLGTFCHENGHMICDFPDLYDYGNQSAGIGGFCLMCTGPNLDEKNPPHVSAYLKYKAGWSLALTRIGANLVASAKSTGNEFFIHRKNDTEYFLVENRQHQGRDMALPGTGLAVWHVDELGDNQDEQMTESHHYECSLVQADGRHDLENSASTFGDATDLFSQEVNSHLGTDTMPNTRWWDGSASGLDLSAIGPSGERMDFKGDL